jgi:hypothetical protein
MGSSGGRRAAGGVLAGGLPAWVSAVRIPAVRIPAARIPAARVFAVGVIVVGVLAAASLAAAGQTSQPPEIVAGRRALAAKQFVAAKAVFAGYLRGHPEEVTARLGLADAELGLRQYEAAELEYRRVVAAQPQLWLAHKNLVIVEAALGRWEEFDRERAVLRLARQRGAPGITARESDVIDSFEVTTRAGVREHWIVREYYEPAGRSLTRYNFERFGPDGRVKAYVSLESGEAAARALAGGDVVVGVETPAVGVKDWVLNFYTGTAHGTVARYPAGEPAYETVRRDVMRWARR